MVPPQYRKASPAVAEHYRHVSIMAMSLNLMYCYAIWSLNLDDTVTAREAAMKEGNMY
jgi:hypothetical protein